LVSHFPRADVFSFRAIGFVVVMLFFDDGFHHCFCFDTAPLLLQLSTNV
jgi:hypothetical protein